MKRIDEQQSKTIKKSILKSDSDSDDDNSNEKLYFIEVDFDLLNRNHRLNNAVLFSKNCS